jgi:pimeloyl-ACP methyl ester carboxylesterase
MVADDHAIFRRGLVDIINHEADMRVVAEAGSGLEAVTRGARSFGSHCIDTAKAISVSAEGGVIEECGHWVFEEKTDFICQQLETFWQRNRGAK